MPTVRLSKAGVAALEAAHGPGLAVRLPAGGKRLRAKAAVRLAAPARPAVARFEAVLPLPPAANNAYANVSGVGRVKTAAAKGWAKAAGLLLLGSPAVRTPAGVTVTVLAGSGLPRRWDVDGRIKLTLDALVAASILPDDDHEFVPVVVGEWDARPRAGAAVVRVVVETVGASTEDR